MEAPAAAVESAASARARERVRGAEEQNEQGGGQAARHGGSLAPETRRVNGQPDAVGVH
jgi:hypothetical protein